MNPEAQSIKHHNLYFITGEISHEINGDLNFDHNNLDTQFHMDTQFQMEIMPAAFLLSRCMVYMIEGFKREIIKKSHD